MSSEPSPGSDPNSPSLKKKGVDGPAPKALPEDTTIPEDGMPLNPGDQSVQFIPAGQDPANGDAKVEIGDSPGHPKFVGLGKEELMKFANDPFWVRLRWFLFILFWIIWLAMLVGAVVIILYAPKCSDKLVGPTDGPYLQVNVKDVSSNGKLDGINDAKIQQLEGLGIKTVIISQILETDPGAEQNPEQVTNFKGVNVLYGSLDHFKTAVKKLQDNAIKVLLQIIPNHSSIKHPWFTNSSRVSTWYVTKAADEESTWASQVSPNAEPGSAWSPIPPMILENENRSYLHQFDNSTADLNYRNDEVIKEMNGVIKFWSEAGVDGFLLSKVSYLLENVDNLQESKSLVNQANADVVKKLLDNSQWDTSGSNRSAPYALLEVTKLSTDKSIPYYSDRIAVINSGLADLQGTNYTVEKIKKIVDESLTKITKYAVHWKLPRRNSDDPRSEVLALVAATLRGQVVLSLEDAGQSLSNFPQFYKDVLVAAKALNQSEAGGTTALEIPSEGVLTLLRSNDDNDFIVAINLGGSSADVDIANMKEKREATVLAATTNVGSQHGQNATIAATTSTITLPSNSGVILQAKKVD